MLGIPSPPQPIDPLLSEYLAGETSFKSVLQTAVTQIRPHAQTVTSGQVGSIEEQLPDIVDSPTRTEGEVDRNSVVAYVETVSGWQETITTDSRTYYHVRVPRNRRRTPSRLGEIIYRPPRRPLSSFST